MALEEVLSGPIGSIGAGLEEVNVQGPAGGIQVQSPQVIEQNKGLWRGFFQKIQEDPNFRQAVLMTGVQMLRSPKMGETGWDVASNALQGGMVTLEGLRQRDYERVQAGKEQELKSRQVRVQERGADTQASTAETYRKATEAQTKQAQDAYELKKKELDEAIRSNQSREEIMRIQAEADMLRAKAYSGDGGGRTPAEIQKINMLTAQYVAQGMDEVQARARAIEYLTETGKAKSPQDRIRLGLESRIKAYNSSLAALDTPLTAEMMQQFLREEIEMEKTLSGLTAPASTNTSGAGSVRSFDRPNVDPQLLAQVKAAVQAGKDVTAIRQRIVQLGHNPADYGL